MADNFISNGEKYECNPENKKGNYDSNIDYGSSSDIPERLFTGTGVLEMKYTM